MDLADIETAMNCIPAKKEDLQKAYEELLSSYPSTASFAFQWKDIDDHISYIENSIRQRFQELKPLDARPEPDNPAAPLPPAIAEDDQCNPGDDPRQKLKTLCISMDAKALRSYIITAPKDHLAIRRELGPALLFAADPVALVLDSFEGFALMDQAAGGEAHAIRKACFTLLESLHQMALDIKPLEKERAGRLAAVCNGLIAPGKMENGVIVSLLLQLIVTFGLVGFFKYDVVLDLLVMAAGRKKTVDLCKSSVLKEKVPDLIEKLNSMGRQIDSLKFVIAFDLITQYPPGHLLDAYVKETKWWAAARERQEQHNTPNFKREDVKRELFVLQNAIKAVEEYNLQHAYRTRGLRRRVKVLKELLNWRFSKSKEPHSNITGKMRWQRGRKQNRQLLSSNSAKTVASTRSESRNLPQLGFVGFTDSYGFGSPPSFYNRGGGSFDGGLIGHGGPVAPPGFPAGL